MKRAYLDLVDAWAVGVIAFELLTQMVPWDRVQDMHTDLPQESNDNLAPLAHAIVYHGIPNNDVNEWFSMYDDGYTLLRDNAQLSFECRRFLNALLTHSPPLRCALCAQQHDASALSTLHIHSQHIYTAPHRSLTGSTAPLAAPCSDLQGVDGGSQSVDAGHHAGRLCDVGRRTSPAT